MAFDLFRYARHGDAAFFASDHVGGSPGDLRVHIGPHSVRRCEFDHGQPLQNTDMRGGDSDCRCRTQCVQEIGRKRAKILVKYDDALGRRAKVMIRKSQDRPHRHGIFSISRGIRDLAWRGPADGRGVNWLKIWVLACRR